MENVRSPLVSIPPFGRGFCARGPARISDVASFPMSLTGVCKHVRVLDRSGLVRRTRRGRENTLEFNATSGRRRALGFQIRAVLECAPWPAENVFDVWID